VSETRIDRSEAAPLNKWSVSNQTIPGGWTTRTVAVGDRRFCVTLPARPDAFLGDPAVLAAHDRTGYMPYWPYLWPAALSMARMVLEAPWEPGASVLELGAGIGLVGLAALARGDRVTFNDSQSEAVELALWNARQNGFERAQGACFDWRKPPVRSFSVILGCEVVYEIANHGPLLDVVESMLAAGGIAWFGDPCRQHAPAFIDEANRRGFAVDVVDECGRPMENVRAGRFQLIQLAKPVVPEPR
jgi:predicted nicotinamide N-methyase